MKTLTKLAIVIVFIACLTSSTEFLKKDNAGNSQSGSDQSQSSGQSGAQGGDQSGASKGDDKGNAGKGGDKGGDQSGSKQPASGDKSATDSKQASSNGATSEEDKATQERIKTLFGDIQDKNNCDKADSSDSSEGGLPFSKPDVYSQGNFGMEEEAYFFDFLQKLLRDDIVKEFEKVYNDVKQLKPDSSYKDPYSIDNLYNSIQLEKNSNYKPDPNSKVTEDQKIAEITQRLPKFSKKNYDSCIHPANIYTACIKYKWDCKKYDTVNYAKGIVDLFDFDGVGCLNTRQFLLMTIVINSKTGLEKACQSDCYIDTIDAKLLPIFKFVDCNNDNKITANGIWNGLMNLKNDFSKEYNIYHPCNSDYGSYRTGSVNRFVNLFSGEKGYLNSADFVKGVLMAYWNRQVKDDQIAKNDDLNKINKRWNDKNKPDIICQKITELNKGNQSNKAALFSSNESKIIADEKAALKGI